MPLKRNILVIGMIFSLLLLFTTAYGDWPREKQGYDPPFVAYDLGKTCGDFIRAKEKKDKGKPSDYYMFYCWVRGYITGLNISLEKGGNVLGTFDANIDDFMIVIEDYSKKNPLDIFISAISVSLKNISPVDWEGNSYKRHD